jgi:hypothetical protein
MTIPRILLPLTFAAIALPCALVTMAQTSNARHATPSPIAASAPTAVPALVPFSGMALTQDGKPMQTEVQINFLIFKDEQGGDALWMETQSAQVDPDGHYKVQLGAASPDGLPLELFSTGEARWLEVQIAGEKPQARILLASVPYALKAGDAATLGGLPVSAFALAGQSPAAAGGTTSSPGVNPATVTTTGGTAGYVSEFSGASTIIDSPLFVASSGEVGINEPAPSATLDVNGTENVRGALSMPAVATANATTGERSQLMQFSSSVWDSATNAAVSPTFELLTYFDGNNTASPSGDFEIHFQQGSTSTRILSITSNGVITFAPTQTFPGTVKTVTATSPLTDLTLNGVTNIGLSASALETTLDGVYAQLGAANTFTKPITFAAGQTFPGTGTGTITRVTAGTGLTGGGTSGAVALSVDTTKVPLLGSANTFAASNTFNANEIFNNGAVFKNGGVTSSTSSETANAAFTGTGTSGADGVSGTSDSESGIYGSTGTGTGVYGTATGQGYAGYFTSGAMNMPTLYAINSSSSAGEAFVAVSTGSGSTGVSSQVTGVDSTGISGSAGAGGSSAVLGYAHGGYDSNHFNSYGVYGEALLGTGVFGSNGGLSDSFSGLAPYEYSAGMWGDTNSAGNGAIVAAVAGTADNNSAAYFYNNSADFPSILAFNKDSGPTGLFKTFKASSPAGTCGIGGSGDLSCTGQLKSLVSASGGSRKVETYAMQSPENWMEDFGSGELQRGVAIITIDPAFAETVTSDAGYHVFLTPNADSKGLYVIRKTATSFEVRESGGGVSSLTFDYRIVAKRRGYEAQRLIDVTESFNAAARTPIQRPPQTPNSVSAKLPHQLTTLTPSPARRIHESTARPAH